MSYVDVFISHGQRDTPKALVPKNRICDHGLSCYVDAEDPDLLQENVKTIADELALAERIRGKLRNCRYIIYAYSAQSLESRWMPWELGFFDARWGPRQIGLYDLDEGRTAAPDAERDVRRSGVLVYLHIYEQLTPDKLQDFLAQA